jgi:hypothetical protein
VARTHGGDPAKKRLKALSEEIKMAYIMITGYLSLLPEPVILPPVDPRNSRPAIQALDRARRFLIRRQRIPGRERQALAAACLSWLNAYEMEHAAIVRDPDDHRLDNIEAALARVVAAAEMVHPDSWRKPGE